MISVHAGCASEYSGTDISASREEKREKKAYDSEEITTKAADWRRDKMRVCGCQTMLYMCCATDDGHDGWRGSQKQTERQRGHFYATTWLGEAAQLGIGDAILEMAMGTFQVPATRRAPALDALRGGA
jgi:hypothetical protein